MPAGVLRGMALAAGAGAGQADAGSVSEEETAAGRQDGLELHSFSTLMQALATRCHHQSRPRDDPNGPTVERLMEPTPWQQRALELVRAYPVDDQFNC